EHLLHARAAAWSLVADDDDVARLDLAGEDAGDGRILALEHHRRPREDQDRLVDAGGLHDGAGFGEVAVEHREAAVLREGVLDVADDALLAIDVELLVAALLAEGGLRRHATRRRLEELAD